jgi:hypothetical protein
MFTLGLFPSRRARGRVKQLTPFRRASADDVDGGGAPEGYSLRCALPAQTLAADGDSAPHFFASGADVVRERHGEMFDGKQSAVLVSRFCQSRL